MVSVGADNDYGHPDPYLLTALADGGAEVARTDQEGDVAVVVDDGCPGRRDPLTRSGVGGAILTAMAAKSPRVLGAVVLVTGSAEFLAERVVTQARDALRDDDPSADFTEVDGGALDLGGFAEMTSPSLFAVSRGVVIRGVDLLPEPMHEPLLDYVAAPSDEVAMVLVHPGGQRGSGLLDKLRKAGAREVKAEAPKPWQLGQWAIGEARRLGTALDDEAADALVLAVGADLRALASALEQLVTDNPGQRLDAGAGARGVRGSRRGEELRHRRSRHRGRRGGCAGAAALGAEPAGAAAAGHGGVRRDPAPAGAARLRTARAARRRPRPRGRLQSVPAQAAARPDPRLGPAGWARAMDAVADADAAIKGAEADGGHALERMVLAVVGAGPSGRVTSPA